MDYRPQLEHEGKVMGRRTAYALLLLLLAFNLALRFLRIDAPPIPLFDEGTFYLAAARAYLDGRPDPNFEHPPLSKVAIAAGLWLFGDTPLGWRSAAALAGTVGVLLTYLLGSALWGRREAGLIAAALLTFETLWFLLSRMAMLDPFLSVGLLAALLCGWRYRQRARPVDLTATGVLLGLAASAKWSAVLALAPLTLAAATAPSPAGAPARRLVRPLVIGGAAAVVYLLVFAVFSGLGPAGLLERHLRMVAYQTAAGVEGTGLGDRIGPPLLWLLNIPVLFTAPGDRAVWALALANPLVFWSGLLATVALLRRGWREPAGPAAYLVAALLALYLPWFLTARARYVYYLMPILPLLCVAVAGVLLTARLTRQPLDDPKREQRQRAAIIGAYLLAVAAVFAALYPPVTAMWR